MASAIGTGHGELVFWEDFLRDNVTPLVETNVDGSTQDITDKHGGWWRQVMAGGDADACLLAAERAFSQVRIPR